MPILRDATTAHGTARGLSTSESARDGHPSSAAHTVTIESAGVTAGELASGVAGAGMAGVTTAPQGEQVIDVTPVLQSLRLSTGVRIQFVRRGDPTGIPMLLLHGFADSWRSFEQVLPFLPTSIHAIALTQRGHGNAEHPATGYRDEDFAADAVALLDALGIDRAVIVGHSLGASVARRMAIRHSDRVAGVVFVGHPGTPRESHEGMVFDKRAIDRLREPIDPALVSEFQRSRTAGPLPAAQLQTLVEESLKVPARVWKSVYKMTASDIAADLRAIRVPTLLMWGDADAGAAEMERLTDVVPDAIPVSYPQAGNALHWEDPDLFANDLFIFAHLTMHGPMSAAWNAAG